MNSYVARLLVRPLLAPGVAITELEQRCPEEQANVVLLEVARLWAAWHMGPLPGFRLQRIGWPVRLRNTLAQVPGVAASVSQ